MTRLFATDTTEPSVPSAENFPAARPAPAERLQIPEILRSVQHNSLMESLLEGWVGDAPRQPDTADALIGVLLDPSEEPWREQLCAAWALGYGPLTAHQKSEANSALLDILQNRRPTYMDRVRGRRARAFHLVFSRTGIVAGICLVADLAQEALGHPSAFALSIGNGFILPGIATIAVGWVLLMGAFGPAALSGVTALAMLHERKVKAVVAESLGRLAMPESLEGLACVAVRAPADMQEAAREALNRLLVVIIGTSPLLLLSRRTLNALHRLLQAAAMAPDRIRPALLMIRLLKEHGGAASISELNRLATLPGIATPVRAAAGEAATVLTDRARRRNEPLTLLRPGARPRAASGDLLRTAPAATLEAAQLPRAAAPPSPLALPRAAATPHPGAEPLAPMQRNLTN